MTRLRIASVEPVEGRTVNLTLTNGENRVVDLTPYLRGPIFEPLLEDDELFRSVTVDAELGTLVWPNGADICPDVLALGRTPASMESAQQ